MKFTNLIFSVCKLWVLDGLSKCSRAKLQQISVYINRRVNELCGCVILDFMLGCVIVHALLVSISVSFDNGAEVTNDAQLNSFDNSRCQVLFLAPRSLEKGWKAADTPSSPCRKTHLTALRTTLKVRVTICGSKWLCVFSLSQYAKFTLEILAQKSIVKNA